MSCTGKHLCCLSTATYHQLWTLESFHLSLHGSLPRLYRSPPALLFCPESFTHSQSLHEHHHPLTCLIHLFIFTSITRWQHSVRSLNSAYLQPLINHSPYVSMSVCLSLFASCRSKFLLDRLGRYLKNCSCRLTFLPLTNSHLSFAFKQIFYGKKTQRKPSRCTSV